MERLSPTEVTVMFLALGTLLASARLFGEVARHARQPAVLGEILAGIFLGPTVLGALAPAWNGWLFPTSGNNSVVLHGILQLAIALFLLVAGLEVDLSTVWRQGKTAFAVACAGMIAPFAIGFPAAWYAPQVLGWEGATSPSLFALFFATALSISALPVIAKTLMDINLYRSDFGMIVIAAAICNDLAGWIIFAVILGMLGIDASHGGGIVQTIGLTLGFAVGMLTLGRWLTHRLLPWIRAYTSWPGGILGFAMSLALFGAACTEAIGVHAIFGAFLVGIAIGDSAHLREQTRAIISQFVSCIFAPLFFASVGLKVNFAAHFDAGLSLLVLLIACLGKVVGCGLGACWSGMPPREAWATGFAMNARGAMEIILGLLALQYGVIQERLFVALVIMALATSMLSGPMMQYLLGRKKRRELTEYLSPMAFLNPLQARNSREAIAALSQAAAPLAGLPADVLEAAVHVREDILPTGLGSGVAAPHARIAGLPGTLVAAGLSKRGIDFDAADGKPAQIIFLILTPREDTGVQLEILAHIEQLFKHPHVRERALDADSFTAFLAAVKGEGAT